MKILLLNSPWIDTDNVYGIKSGTRWASLRKKDRQMPYYPFPYFLASATAVLKKAGFSASVKDAIAEELSREETLAWLEGLRPEMLVIEAFTPSIHEDLAFMKEAKERVGCASVFCGVHPSALPQEILQHEHMDFVLMGEFDITLLELAAAFSAGEKDLSSIRGLAYKRDGKILINGPRERISDLDELPFPERDDLPMARYNEASSLYYPNTKIVTSRGCPYGCIFCIEPFTYHGTYKKRSVALVIEEIRQVVARHGVKEVFFDDAIFTIERALEIARALTQERIKIAWSCWVDWNVSLDDLKALKQSGCVGVKFGVESPDAQILKTARKPVTREKIVGLVDRCRAAGLLRHGAFLFGLPGDTPASMRRTLDFLFSLDLTSSQLAIATPLPGTAFYTMAKEKGWLTTDDWGQYECHYHAVVRYPGCDPKDIIAAIDEARQRKVRQLLRHPWLALRYAFKQFQLLGPGGFLKEVYRKGTFMIRGAVNRKTC
jgi:radical SAM superfamily enzyme YgiQ (UPF0313 family)